MRLSVCETFCIRVEALYTLFNTIQQKVRICAYKRFFDGIADPILAFYWSKTFCDKDN